MGSKSSKPSGTTTTTQNSEPWAEQKPYLTNMMANAQNLYDTSTPSYYPSSTYAAPNSTQTQALANLSYTAQNDLLPATSSIMTTDLMSGKYLNANPQAETLKNFAADNAGANGTAYSILNELAQRNYGTNNAGTSTLTNQATNDHLINNNATNRLGSLQNDTTVQGSGVLERWANADPYLSNLGNTRLYDFSNVGTSGPAASTQLGLANEDIRNSDQYLTMNHFAKIAADNPAMAAQLGLTYNDPTRNDPYKTQNYFSKSEAGNPAYGSQQQLANLDPSNTDAYQTQNAFSRNAAADPGSRALGSYASGERLAVGNPYLDAVSKSVLSRTMPGVTSQFINSGTLSSPEAMRASSEGAASALAPYAFDQYQKDQLNQIDAAKSLNTNSLAQRELQQSAANNLGSLTSQGWDTRAKASSDLANQALQGRELQQNAATSAADTMLRGQTIQGTNAANLANQSLQSRELQQNASNNALDAALRGKQVQSTAAGDLADQALRSRGFQQQAASDLASSINTGAQTATGAATDLGKLGLQSRELNQNAALGLGDLYLKGFEGQRDAASELGTQAIAGAKAQSDSAAALGSQVLAGRELQQKASDTATQSYDNQVDNMVRALALAPETQKMQYTPWENMYDAGAGYQAFDQAALDDEVARWDYEQQAPYEKLNSLSSIINGDYGKSTTRSDPYFTNKTGSALYSGLGGASLGSALFPSATYGATGGLLGGGLGLLSSLFS